MKLKTDFRRRWRDALLSLALAVFPCLGFASFEWPAATPEQVNIDAQALDQVSEGIIRGDYGAVRSFLVLRHGKLVYEQYYRGYRQDDLMEMFSVTKGLAAALVGVARRLGDLPPVDTTLADLFPSYAATLAANPGAGAIRFRDILTQRHGFEWDEWSTSWLNPANSAYQMMRSNDWWQYVLELPVTAAPDDDFRYSTGASNLIGLAFWEQAGVSAADYALVNLFPALDIAEFDVRITRSGAPPDAEQGIFPEGFTPTGHGFWMKARDLAKIGQLYLDRGVFRNHRLFEKSWVSQSMVRYSDNATDPDTFGVGIGYGYQWWISDMDTPHGPVEVWRAWGYGDQYIFVVPAFDTVVVTTAGNWVDEGPDMRLAMTDIIADAIGLDFDPLSDGGLTGPWAAPELPSQGFMLEIVPSTGQVVLFWMTFDPVTGDQMWLIGPSRLKGRRTLLSFLKPVGGAFAGPREAQLEPWGEGELEFTSCTTARLSYRSESGDHEGAFDMVRITPNVYCSEESFAR